MGSDAGKSGHIDFLDHLRGVAILGVFLFHCLTSAYGVDRLEWKGWTHDFNVPGPFLAVSPAIYGAMGVAIFFAISGFCIHLSHQRTSKDDWVKFFVRRFFRIYPPYLLVLLVCLALYPRRDYLTTDQIVSHLFLVHNFRPLYVFYGINGPFWSIAVEVQLYLLYPVLLLLIRRLGWSGAVLLTALIEISYRIVFGLTSPTPDELLIGSPLAYWLSWSAGAWAAEAYLTRTTIPLFRLPVWFFVGMMVVVSLIKPLSAFTFTFASLATVSAIGLFLRLSAKGWMPSLPVLGPALRFVGIVSYSVYLLHQPLIRGIYMASLRLPLHVPEHGFVRYLICLAGLLPILAISWGFYRLVEMPSIELGKWILRQRDRSSGRANAPKPVVP